MSEFIGNRYDFVYLFDVLDGNPNGDPDAGNLPRVDAETSQGLVTDVCLKRKVRNYIAEVKRGEPGYRIYVKEKSVLNSQNEEAYKALDMKAESKKMPKDKDQAEAVTLWMCTNFFDIRAFGAVMTTEINAGQVRGPIQFTMARSIDPVVSAEFSITRCAVTNEKDLEKERTMGRKFTVPYGLYRCHGYINATLAEQTKFSNEDLELFKNALNNMFENDRSAARGLMAPVKCVAFRHENRLGNARADQLFSRVKVTLKPELKAEDRPARSRDDYDMNTDKADLPAGVSIEEWVK